LAFDEYSMKSGPFDFWTASTGYSGWSFCCALFSTFGVTGYYSSLLRHRVPDWLMVGLLMAPITIILLTQWGIGSDRVVATFHLVATSLFMTLALGMELGIMLGYRPIDSGFFRLSAHLGWTFAWAGIYRRAKRTRQKILEEGAKPESRPPSH
jgi:hypothetical protein